MYVVHVLYRYDYLALHAYSFNNCGHYASLVYRVHIIIPLVSLIKR